jgi:diguanylate cyclase (GGDEF)-like protein
MKLKNPEPPRSALLVAGEFPAVDTGLLRAMARHQEHLKNHPDGAQLLHLINNALLNCQQRGYVNASCIAHLHDLLLAFARDTSRPSPIRIRARLIQQHLALYLQPGRAASVKSAKPPEPFPAAPEPVPAAAQSRIASPTKPEAELIPHPAVTSHSTENAVMENQGVLEAKPALAMEAPETSRPASEGATQNLNQLRQMVTNSMDELMRERETLSQKLSDANTYLKMIEAEREQLRTDLNMARKRARTGDKPLKKALGLPKRDVLLRQIESEVERVKRHGDPLALALIDIDSPETVNDTEGQEVANAARQLYANEILRGFRSYDMVAHYNKDEFAVLLPSTDREDAMRALEKVRKRATESHFSFKGRSYPLPGFGGVLTFYSPGEEPRQMLRRADEALVNLKLKGQRQVVVV